MIVSSILVFLLWFILIFTIFALLGVALLFIATGINEGMDQETNEIVNEMKHRDFNHKENNS